MDVMTATPWQISDWHILLRLLLAVVLGGLIGFEREQSNHAAGLRTNILVCLGSCLLMLLSMYGFSEFVNETNVRVDPARLASAVVTGVGFLGAGTILFTGKSITGLTTAASLWVVAAIGLSTGAGFYFASISVTLIMLLVLYTFNKLERKYIASRTEKLLKVQLTDRPFILKTIHAMLSDRQIIVKKLIIEDDSERDSPAQMMLQFYIRSPKPDGDWVVLDEIKQLEGVSRVSLE
ncbi:MgtC/SapB family protein [Paenibacillus protaetiae]|uniref:MgtC/SapB family protein n=1 Tax=Paenibacillus protaetiae TaxID=2509456 RepID=A0A4P6EX69_9BACL|nr:MgtC/SapB family protein [Paenibacillus protaetiae]QAY66823.1 MgtC/SapB family protein [Paenibacillus protaetiae]